MKRVAYFILMALVLTGLFASIAFAKDDKIPTKITSDRMVYESGGSQVTFTGNVHVTRPDMQIWSQKMIVHLKQTTKKAGAAAAPLGGDPGEIEKIVALKKVRMLREGKEGFCGKATYMVEKDLLVMEEWPRLVDGKNTIQGKIIRLYLKENRSEVEGTGNTQVEAIFFTPKDAGKPAAETKPAADDAQPEVPASNGETQ
ncbi:LptA/OstA family protein [Desulfovibrio ferrophilus]|uniref:OstA family protein n=1 Tax=Desulfovibrio ferrophilus TaxID=241368 RepID=A0A2Z6AWG8_9BACT|nr:LptA/OstA family protein [Desulfovibrio ferrophilus]BBD07571.1 OstA family protein [Desulfovibrio ferrophilus]